ncbi:hypothetical protein CFOL_v3_12786 [Cephalotus follicularis]|uniref:Remorin C-terminal domain-containing protein n=1 Tax=Cephalotus follicularis TaxID=3775 RepID=A0A1Q3BMU8_CEPFO|nr:hypothetical protein CFOL_v3_12786 [Cephalotus follicularis]
MIRWQNYGRCCPSWSMKPLLDALPDSPLPICSNGFSPLTAATSDSFHSQSKLERSRVEALETTQKRIDRARKEATEKKKLRESAVQKISRVTSLSLKIQAAKNFNWLNLKRQC